MSTCIILHYNNDLQQLHSTIERVCNLISSYLFTASGSMNKRTGFPDYFGDTLKGKKRLEDNILLSPKKIQMDGKSFLKVDTLSNGIFLRISTNTEQQFREEHVEFGHRQYTSELTRTQLKTEIQMLP